MSRVAIKRITARLGPLRQADAARDSRDWPRARDLYRQVLDNDPMHATIWVQYGHALKESGDVRASKSAYERAIAIDDQVADFHLQLGHALKLLGDLGGALEAYRRAYALDPTSRGAAQELHAMDPSFQLVQDFELVAQPNRRQKGDFIVIDLSDVFFYLRHHPTLSGIQRVQMGIAEALIELRKKISREIKFIVGGGPLGGYIELRHGAIGRLGAELADSGVTHGRLLKILEDEELSGSLFKVMPGDTVVVLGAFWVIENAVERFVRIKQLGGRLVVLIHDLIPIMNPEYCEASLTDTFKIFCWHVLQIADLVLTVSDHSGRQVVEFLESSHSKVPTIRTLRSAHQSLDTSLATAKPSARVASIVAKPFVLYVSTIEIRKNHTLLFRIWKELIRRHGAAATPKLVFVGRPGWRVRDLMDQLQSTRNLEGQIEIVNGLSDTDLAVLYKSALFSAFPSFEEGWGLPVGESLIFGTPCVASNTSSVPEVAGDFVAYEDPHNLWASYALYERMIFEPDYRAGFAKRIRETFRPRTWSDVATELLELLDEHVPAGARGGAVTPTVLLDPGRLFLVGHHGRVGDYLRYGLGERVHFMFDDAWGAVEEHVRWQRKRTATIQFSVPYEAPCEILLVLFVDTVAWLGETSLVISVDDQTFQEAERTQGRTSKYALRCRLSSPHVVIRFELVGEIVFGADPRPLSYGLRALGYAGLEDAASRAGLAEGVLFESVGVKTLSPN